MLMGEEREALSPTLIKAREARLDQRSHHREWPPFATIRCMAWLNNGLSSTALRIVSILIG